MIILLPTPKDFLNFHKRVLGGVRDQNLKSLAFTIIKPMDIRNIYGSKICTMQVKLDAYEIGPQAACKGFPPKCSRIQYSDKTNLLHFFTFTNFSRLLFSVNSLMSDEG